MAKQLRTWLRLIPLLLENSFLPRITSLPSQVSFAGSCCLRETALEPAATSHCALCPLSYQHLYSIAAAIPLEANVVSLLLLSPLCRCSTITPAYLNAILPLTYAHRHYLLSPLASVHPTDPLPLAGCSSGVTQSAPAPSSAGARNEQQQSRRESTMETSLKREGNVISLCYSKPIS